MQLAKQQPGYKQTEVGMIPADWVVLPLCQITDASRPISYGIVQTGPNVLNGVRCLRVLDVENGQVNKQNLITTTKAISDSYKRTILREGDLVTPLRGKVGEVASIDQELVGANLTRGVALIAIRPEQSPLFVKQVISSQAGRTRLEQSMNGSALQEVSIASLRAFKIPLPPTLVEQEVIASTLSDADGLVEALEKLIAKKRQIKDGTMQELLTGKRRLPGFSAKWETKRIGEFTDCTAGGTPSTLIEDYWGGTIRWMSSGELNLKSISEVEGRITHIGLQNSSARMLPCKCVLIGLAGQGKTRGTVAINLVELCTNQSIAAIFPSPAFVPEYLYYNLDRRYKELRELSAGDGGRGGLNLTIIKSLEVSLPTLDEQSAIAAILSDIDAQITTLESKLKKARQVKQGMMQELLTGRVRLV